MRGRQCYILRRLPGSWLGGDKRKLWGRLIALVEAKKDDDFRWRLYRKQVPGGLGEGKSGQCIRFATPGTCRELEKRHPEGMSANLAEVSSTGSARARCPLIIRHLNQVWRSWSRAAAMARWRTTREKGLGGGQPDSHIRFVKEFNKQVLELVENGFCRKEHRRAPARASGSVPRVERPGDHDGASTGGIHWR
jgi:hypothetical protein